MAPILGKQSFNTDQNAISVHNFGHLSNKQVMSIEMIINNRFDMQYLSLIAIGINPLSFHHKCHSLIGYATHYISQNLIALMTSMLDA